MADLTLNRMVAIKRWTNALREGKHQRCSRYLQDGDRFCAVGLGCAVNGFKDINCAPFSACQFLENVTGIRGFIFTGAGFRREHDDAGRIVFFGIANMNDLGESWCDIADRIERDYLPDGFVIPDTLGSSPKLSDQKEGDRTEPVTA